MGEFFLISCQKACEFARQWGTLDGPRGELFAWRLSSQEPEELAFLRQRCQTLCPQGASIGLRPARFDVKALFFDMDATLVVGETIDDLAALQGCGDRVAALTAQAMAGEVSFRVALAERVRLLAGLPLSAVESLAGKLVFQSGAAEFAARCRQRGVRLFIASGGFNPLVGPVALQLGCEAFLANELPHKDGALTGELPAQIVDGPAKADWLKKICRSRGLRPDEAVAVGDGANDRAMMQTVGLAVGFHPKPALVPYLDVINQSGSHRFLADFLFANN